MVDTSPHAAWRRLGRELRQELLHNGGRHPDPQVAAVAAAYARSMLGWRGYVRRVVVPGLLLMLLLIALLSLSVQATFAAAVEDARFQMVALVLWLGVVVWYIRRDLRRLKALNRMEYANSAPLPASRPVAEPVPAGPLVVGYDMKRVRRDWALAALFPAVMALGAYQVAPPVVYVPLLLLTLAAVVAIPLVRLVKPALVLDASGVTLPRHGFTVPWSQISAVRLMPLPRGVGRRGSGRMLAFVLTDEELLLRTAPPRLVNRMRRAKNFFGHPLIIADSGLTSDAAAIAQAARALGGVPCD